MLHFKWELFIKWKNLEVIRGQLEVKKIEKMINRKIFHNTLFVQGVFVTLNWARGRFYLLGSLPIELNWDLKTISTFNSKCPQNDLWICLALEIEPIFFLSDSLSHINYNLSLSKKNIPLRPSFFVRQLFHWTTLISRGIYCAFQSFPPPPLRGIIFFPQLKTARGEKFSKFLT